MIPVSAFQKDVVRQTEEVIRRSMDQLKASRPLVWEALELKKRLALWQSQTASLNVLQLVSGIVLRRVCIYLRQQLSRPRTFVLLCSGMVGLTRLEVTLLARLGPSEIP